MNLPAGTFSVGGTVLSVRVVGDLADINTIKNLSVPTPNGNRRLSDLATIIDTGTEITERTVFFDKKTGERFSNVIVMELQITKAKCKII